MPSAKQKRGKAKEKGGDKSVAFIPAEPSASGLAAREDDRDDDAAITASQAVSSGIFSLTRQAVLFDHFPGVDIYRNLRQSDRPDLPSASGLAPHDRCIVLVIGFETLSNLAAAYGVAVITTIFGRLDRAPDLKMAPVHRGHITRPVARPPDTCPVEDEV